MDAVAKMPARERDELFQETASRRGLRLEIIEKDFWVCWTLRHLFGLPGFGQHLIFKGGTSLSKIFKVIERFSEDIDVSINRDCLGIDPEAAAGSNERKRRIEVLGEACRQKIVNEALPELENAFRRVLGDSGGDYVKFSDEPSQPTLLFTYPRSGAAQRRHAGYISPAVRVEFGARSDHWPSEKSLITPYAAEQFPDFFTEPSYELKVLAAERTFWEKATLLHAEYHRPETSNTAERISRHYYDLYMLGRTPTADRAIDALDLLARVVEHKKLYFRSGRANYEAAGRGSIRLAPSESKLAPLKVDYAKMKDMFFGEIPAFDEIVKGLTLLEARINAASSRASAPGGPPKTQK